MYSNQADEFLMNSAAAAAAGVSIPSSGAMPPMAADTLYASQGYSYPPIYSHHQQQQQHDPGGMVVIPDYSADYAFAIAEAHHRASTAARHHRELLAHHPGAPSNIIPSMQPLSVYVSGNMDIRPGSSSSSTSSAAQSWMAWSPTQGNLGEEGFSTEGNALQASVQGKHRNSDPFYILSTPCIWGKKTGKHNVDILEKTTLLPHLLLRWQQLTVWLVSFFTSKKVPRIITLLLRPHRTHTPSILFV